MDGYEVARQLRQRAEGRPPRLVAVTGYGQEKDRARALAAGFDDHIVKPIDLDDLFARLARLMSTAES
jgi:CheY-like chemotaxis protein